jgi:uncharacterized membrane protein
MRPPGPIEIVIIIAVIMALALVTRIFRAKWLATEDRKDSPAGTSPRQGKVRERRSRRQIKRLGIILTLVGIILLIIGISMFKWAFQTYIWSCLVAAVGLVLLALSVRR